MNNKSILFNYIIVFFIIFKQDPIEKKNAEKMFMEIQEACNILSQYRKSKSKQNQKTDEF